MIIDHNFLEQSLNGTYDDIDRTICVVYAESSFFQVEESIFERNLTDQIISYSLGGKKVQGDTGDTLGGNDAEFVPIEPSNLPIRYPDRELSIENSYPFTFNFSRNSSFDPPGMETFDYYFPKDECVYWDMTDLRWNNTGTLSENSPTTHSKSSSGWKGVGWIEHNPRKHFKSNRDSHIWACNMPRI